MSDFITPDCYHIRALAESDLPELREIHEKWYSDQFEFPYFGQFFNPFVITRDNKIITGGGVLPIAEVIILTEKDFSHRIRLGALRHALELSRVISANYGFPRFHVFCQDPRYKKQLLKAGFTIPKGDIVSINSTGVRNGRK